jgi:flagellar L-ring protein precursor FlgH
MKLIATLLGGLVFVALALMTGCATPPSTGAKTEAAAAPIPDTKAPAWERVERPVPAEGSLWTDTNSRLFVDLRAKQVGDLVTVRISEKPTGKLSAKTQTSRDSTIEAGISDFLGYMKALQAKNPNFDRTSMFDANFKPSFTGQGTNNREGELDAYVTARVEEVLPNGTLRIRGRQEIKVNNETQHITLSGIIRPEDIDTNNEVQSTYVAEAHIEYSGKGVISDKQRPGWLMRALDHVWPF